MYREGRSMCELAAVAVDERCVYLGFQGSASSVAIFKQADMTIVGLYLHMCGSASKLLAVSGHRKLVCLTSAGYLYVWDTGDDTLESLSRIINDPLTLDGFVHPDVRVRPVVEVAPTNMGDCVDVDYLAEASTLLTLSSGGEVTLRHLTSGVPIGSFCPAEGEGMRALCVKANDRVSSFRNRKGYWIAIGGSKGRIFVTFLPLVEQDGEQDGDHDGDPDGDPDSGATQTPVLDTSDVYTAAQTTSSHVDVKCLTFRQKSSTSASMTLVAGCSDGTVRCFVFKQTEDELQPHKSASYVHCRAAKRGNVSRLLSGCSANGSPYIVTLCSMQLAFDYHTMPSEAAKPSPSDSSTFCTEVLLQTLLPDQCDNYEMLAQVRDVVTDLKPTADDTGYVFTTSDDLYVIRPSDSAFGWHKPQRLEWQSADNTKLMSKLM
ncbi:di- and tripeptidase [Babesia caballi]|uniref:Di- and tripeptidase n=1 Tax=Babesia caballi TaxID=5871 RepID=A0AAV4M2X9_BABCB|nr:di- and tripeptidase [Babesia caballi]